MHTIVNDLMADFTNAKNKCRTTVGKEYTDNGTDRQFNIKLLISEHSPIRLLTVDWSWRGIKSWVATHWSRHKWECFISTQRTDRTGINRDDLPQGELVNFDGVANAQHLIDTMRKRLCFQASPETRELAEDLKETLMLACPELGEVLVPNCVYRCGCPEFNACGFWKKYLDEVMKDGDYELLSDVALTLSDIQYRYELYNDIFDKRLDNDK